MLTQNRLIPSLWPLVTAAGMLASTSGLCANSSDPEAQGRVDRMILALGGHEIWGRARSMQLRYQGVMQFAAPVGSKDDVETAWRDLQEPNERIEHKAEGIARLRIMTTKGTWRVRDGTLSTLPPQQHAAAQLFWRRDFYTMLRRLAAHDAGLVLRLEKPNRVAVASPAGESLGWFEIDERGLLMKWGTSDDDGSALEYVYGPLGQYGPIRFPRWVASVDGRWRADYAHVSLSEQPLDPPLLTPPP